MTELVERLEGLKIKEALNLEDVNELASHWGSDLEDDVKLQVYEALGDLARKEVNREPLRQKGAVEACCRILPSQHEKLRAFAMRGIANLCFDSEDGRTRVNAEDIQYIVDSLKSNDLFVVRIASGCIANLCSTNEQKCVEVSGCGAIDLLLELVNDENVDVVVMVLKALTNLCSSEAVNSTLFSKGAMGLLVKKFLMANQHDEDVLVETVLALSSLCELKTHALDFIEEFRGLNLVLDLVNMYKDDEDIDETVLKTLLDLLYDLAEQDYLRIKFDENKIWQGLLELFLNSQDNIIRERAIKCIAHLTLDDVVAKVIFTQIDTLLQICTFNDDKTGEISQPEKEIELSALMIAANMIRDDTSCIALMSKGFDKIVLKALENPDKDARIKHMAASALKNLSILDKNKETLLEQGFMKHLVDILKVKDDVVIYAGVTTIKSLFGAGMKAWKEYVKYDPDLAIMIQLTLYDGDSRKADHVFYEASRVIALLCRLNEESLTCVMKAENSMESLKNLVQASFDLLREEGYRAVVDILKYEPTTVNQVLESGIFDEILKITNDQLATAEEAALMKVVLDFCFENNEALTKQKIESSVVRQEVLKEVSNHKDKPSSSVAQYILDRI